MRYYMSFGLLSSAIVAFLYLFIYSNTTCNPYAVWVAALTITTFVMYGLDKLLSKMGNARIPELILHLLAILGGFPGAWLGMALFRHKTNVREHPWFVPVLLLSTLGHGLLTYYWFFMGN